MAAARDEREEDRRMMPNLNRHPDVGSIIGGGACGVGPLHDDAVAAIVAASLGFLLSAALDRIVSERIVRLARTASSVAVSHDFALRAT